MKSLSLSVLIVDDNIDARKLLRSVLMGLSQRIVIHETSQGAEVVDKFERNCFDIIFLDIEMPGMNGFEILEKILLTFPDQFIVMISANATVVNVKKTIELGGQGFIAKPYTTRKVKAVVDRYLTKNGNMRLDEAQPICKKPAP